MRKATATGTILAAMVLGCAGQGEMLATQVDELKQQLVELRKTQARMAVTVEDLETRLFLVQDELDTGRKRAALRRSPEQVLPVVRVKRQPGPEGEYDPMADQPMADQPMADQPMADRPKVAGAGAEPPPVVRYDHFDSDGELVRGSPQPEGARGARQEAAVPRKDAGIPQSDLDATRMYKAAKELLDADRYEEAIAGFRELVEKLPTHTLADNALYWMGEAYYDRGLWLEAMSTFQKVLQSYPLENKAPDAMLKLGLCHAQLRNVRQAREVLHQVTEIYPGSPVAKLAADRLEQLQ